jgi:tetrahydrodipicolinate N-succinyltransferase
VWRKEGIGTLEESTTSKYTKVKWVDAYGETHSKTINHSTTSGVPVCATAPNYEYLKEYLQEYAHSGVDEEKLVSVLSQVNLRGYEVPKIYGLSMYRGNQEEYAIRTEYMDQKKSAKETKDVTVIMDFHDVVEETIQDEEDEMQELSARQKNYYGITDWVTHHFLQSTVWLNEVSYLEGWQVHQIQHVHHACMDKVQEGLGGQRVQQIKWVKGPKLQEQEIAFPLTKWNLQYQD